MNLQLNERASASPSVDGQHLSYQRRIERRTLPRDFSLALQIALVADNNHGEVVLVLDAENLLLESGDLLETLARSDVVNKQETLSRPHVLFAHGAVLLLTGGVENIEKSDLVVNVALLAVRVWVGQ